MRSLLLALPLVCAMVGSAKEAKAETLIYVGQSIGESNPKCVISFLVDKDTVRRDGDIVSGWERTVFNNKFACVKEPGAPKWIKSRVAWDCADMSMTTYVHHITSWDNKLTVVEKDSSKWEYLTSGEIGYDELRIVCSWKL